MYIYHSGNHLTIQFNIALSIPFEVHVELDTLLFCFVYIHIGEVHGHRPEIKFDEMKCGKRTRKHLGQHGFNNVLEQPASGGVDIGPQSRNYVVEESWETISLTVLLIIVNT